MRTRVWKIMGKYGNMAMEEIDSFASRDEARRMEAEYIMAFGSGWRIWIKIGSN